MHLQRKLNWFCVAVLALCTGGIAQGQSSDVLQYLSTAPLQFSVTPSSLGQTDLRSFTEPAPATQSIIEGGFVNELREVQPTFASPALGQLPQLSADSVSPVQTTIAPSSKLESAAGQWITVRSKLRTERIFVQPQDEIWIVSARQNQLDPNDLSRLNVSKLSHSQFQPSQLSELTHAHQTDRSRKTIMFTHGNRTNYSWAISRGMLVYRNLFSTCSARAPIRMVIFAWESERETPLPIVDYRIKAKKSVCLGTTFGLLLNQFQNRDLMLVGYSLGAQLIMSGLESEHQPASNERYEISLIAPAFDCDWLASRATAPPTTAKANRATVFVNRNDRVIKVANRVCQREYPSVNLSLQEIAATRRLPVARVDFVDLTSESSKVHSIVRYTKSPSLRNGIYQQLIDVCRDCNRPTFVPVSQ